MRYHIRTVKNFEQVINAENEAEAREIAKNCELGIDTKITTTGNFVNLINERYEKAMTALCEKYQLTIPPGTIFSVDHTGNIVDDLRCMCEPKDRESFEYEADENAHVILYNSGR